MRTWTRIAVLTMFVLTAACRGVVLPTSPARVPDQPTNPPRGVTACSGSPSQLEATRTFAYSAPGQYGVSWYTAGSVFCLAADSRFTLAYPHVAYHGRFHEADGEIRFTFDGWSSAGPWEATGRLSDDSLTVHYNITMALSDFEDAVYVLAR